MSQTKEQKKEYDKKRYQQNKERLIKQVLTWRENNIERYEETTKKRLNTERGFIRVLWQSVKDSSKHNSFKNFDDFFDNILFLYSLQLSLFPNRNGPWRIGRSQSILLRVPISLTKITRTCNKLMLHFGIWIVRTFNSFTIRLGKIRYVIFIFHLPSTFYNVLD